MGKRRDLEYVRELAREKGGECLSPVYLGMHEKHVFRCGKCSLEWSISPKLMFRRSFFCPFCEGSKTKKNIQYVKHMAQKKGGVCLSLVFLGMAEKHLFKCGDCQHEWEAAPREIDRGGWCPICARARSFRDLEFIDSLARARGGSCLSTVYIGMREKYLFKCGDCQHEWEAAGNDIQQGGWCPHCRIGKGEKTAIAYASTASGVLFEKSRPRWLRSSRRYPMELDGYSPTEKMAIEYNGRQHYDFLPSHFHRNGLADFESQLERDRIKAELVVARGILLLPIRASEKADPASVRASVRKAAEDACFPLLGVNREFTRMCVEMGRPPMHRFSACLHQAASRVSHGE